MREFTSVNGRKNGFFIFWLETYLRTYISMIYSYYFQVYLFYFKK